MAKHRKNEYRRCFGPRDPLFVILLATIGAVEAQLQSNFDCVDAFELTRIATTFGCAAPVSIDQSDKQLSAAATALVDAGFFDEDDIDGIRIDWCPLTNAMGFTPNESRILIDDGIKIGSIDLIAEVLAHELIHIRQFKRLGQRGFKCAYVNAYIGCGGCQGRSHQLEREAYEFQDRVRTHFLESWQGTNVDAQSPAHATSRGDNVQP